MTSTSTLRILIALAPSVAASLVAAQDITVSAAASLKPSFLAIGKQFEEDNPDIKLKFNFAGSGHLASQIEQGAPVDVYASADRRTLMDLVGKNLIASHGVLAHNSLTAIFFKAKTPDKPKLEDLSRPGLKLVMPSPKLPAGIYVQEFLSKADAAGLAQGQFSAAVRSNTVSEEPDIRLVATKIAMGAADGGIVYLTDVTPDLKDKVVEIAIPAALNVRAEYTIGIVATSKKKNAARRFYDHVLSLKGQAALAEFGFLPAL